MRKSLIFLTAFSIAIFMLFSCEKNSTESEVNVSEVTTAEVSNITDTTAQCGGTITSDGGAFVTARGVCWSTSQTPTVDDNKTTDSTGIGSFTSNMTGLTGGTTYYVRAYATNSAGTGYGSAISFTTLPPGTGTVTDIDGNTYQTLKIGNQWWMAENLRVTHYRNGDAIPEITDRTTWGELSTGARCAYNNDANNESDTYGYLYNWYAVIDPKNIAPPGWHVPTDEEWKELEKTLGMSQSEADKESRRGTNEGSKLASRADLWNDGKLENDAAFSESGFSAIPGGSRIYYGDFAVLGSYAYFWLSTEFDPERAWIRYVSYSNTYIFRFSNHVRYGFSVRLVRD